MNDAELAAHLAQVAGKLLLDVRASGVLSGQALGKAGDETANEFLCHALRTQRPDDGERTDWAVHVALAIDGRPEIGAVALPGLDLVLRTDRSLPLAPCPKTPRMVVSRTRPAKEALDVAEKISAELIPMGSAGAKAMAIVRGDAEIYLHTGGQYEWDSCAPAAVALAYGLHVSRIDGSPMTYNQADVYMPDLLICRPEWAERVLSLLG